MNTGKGRAEIRPRFGIRQKLITLCCSVIAGTLILTVLVAHYYVAEKTKSQTDMFNRMSLQSVADRLDLFVDSLHAFYYQILVNSEIANFVENQYEDEWDRIANSTAAQLSLQEQVTTMEFINSAAVIRADGAIVASSSTLANYLSERFQNEWKSQLLLLKNSRDEALITSPYNINGPGPAIETMFTYIRRLYDPNNHTEVSGYIIINVKQPYLNQIIQPICGIFDMTELKANGKPPLFRWQSEQLNEPQKNPDFQWNYSYPMKRYPYVLRAYSANLQLSGELAAIRNLFILLCVLATGLALVQLIPILSRILRPLKLLTKTVDQIADNDLSVHTEIQTHDELRVLGDGLNHMVDRLKEYSLREKEHQINEMNMEYGLLIAQIHPHFIYNALNSIKYLAASGKAVKVEQVVNSLIHLLQDSLRLGEDRVFTTLEKEVEITSYYCDIQKIRYPDIFDIKINIDDSLMGCKVPKTIVQPLVENAILHGIVPAGNSGAITVTGERDGDYLRLTVADTGIGMENDLLQEIYSSVERDDNSMRHIGMANILKRFRFIYSGDASVEIRSMPGGGTTVTMMIPQGDHRRGGTR